MPLGQLPRVPHITRWGNANTSQPFRWCVMRCLLANGPYEWMKDGVLLGWQGWHMQVISHPLWRYTDGTLIPRRVTLAQWPAFDTIYRWQAYVREPADVGYYTLSKHAGPSFNRLPWDDIPFVSPWEPLDPFVEPSWLMGDTWCYWYRTAQAALAAWPDAIHQDDYEETFGWSLGI